MALRQIMEAKEMSIHDLNTLKGNIEKEVILLADKLKGIYELEKSTEVVFFIFTIHTLVTEGKRLKIMQ